MWIDKYIIGGYVENLNDIIIDTLNLTYWIYGNIDGDNIFNAINLITKQLKDKYKGRMMFVIKDKESEFNTDEDRNKFIKIANDNKIYIYIVEKYKIPPKSSIQLDSKEYDKHSSLGRDDFYMSILANKYKCSILTNDRLKDFKSFKYSISPFYVLELNYFIKIPNKDYINPSKYNKLKKPKKILPDDILIL